MEIPEILGYEVRAEIGRGSTGVVYDAVDGTGERWAIKVFESMSSNVSLLGQQVRRLVDGGAGGVTVEVVAQALEGRPSLVVMPFYADAGGCPQNLQRRERSGYDWAFLTKLASVLKVLHRARVAHGNLKPGHVFLGAEGELLLADYATGLMPGVHHYQYSDAILYAPPEQLRNPGGYLEEAGYRWDVYAFGVLAYRLLYGVFPRANDIFEPVSPAFGADEKFEIEADHEGVASALEASGSVLWPEGAVDEVEARRREILEACLSLDPQRRPFDMGEVLRLFEVIDGDLERERDRLALVAAREEAVKKRKSANRRFAMVSLVALALAAGWAVTQVWRVQEVGAVEAEFEDYRETAEGGIAGLQGEVLQAEKEEVRAKAARDESARLLAGEKRKALAELSSAQRVNEKLFDWILEEGVEELPILEGRKARLDLLLEMVDGQLAGLAERPALAGQAAVLRLRGAELALAAGDLKGGRRRLEEALGKGGLSAKLTARGHLRLLLLTSKEDAGKVEALLRDHEESIREAWVEDEAGRQRVEAALALAKARMWESQGAGEKALSEYLMSLQKWKELEERYPENPALTLRVGRGYLAAALAAEGEGAVDNTAKLREEAAEAFVALAKKQETPSSEVAYQIASARAGQAIAKWQQGDVFGAEKMAREGMARLSALQAKMPGDFRVTIDLVSQQGILATALRDEGKSTEARVILKKGIAQLETGLGKEPGNGVARYLLASLKWQLSGLLGQEGDSAAELKMGREARDGLQALLEEKLQRPHPVKVRKALAYLCGDLGHAADLHEKRALAVEYLQECRRYWQELKTEDAGEPEYREGYQWAVDRLTDLGAK